MATEKLEKPSVSRQEPESVYTARELAENHNAFGVPKELVTVALRVAGKDSITFPEAKRIVEVFSKKEV